jgi:magnesium-transporting ATPase (P-type)
MFESTTVFQRLKTLGTLNAMSSKPYTVQVYRAGRWGDVSTERLLPGDLISVKRKRAPKPPAQLTPAQAAAMDADEKEEYSKKAASLAAEVAAAAATDVVPCDCVLLRGDAVVNEATLTGESTPQMKDALPSAAAAGGESERALDMHGRDRVHVLFSGSSLISTMPGGQGQGGQGGGGQGDEVPQPPNGGCVCYVLRTGFSSAQGELLQLIEFSTQSVNADSRETLMALFVLLLFALAAAGYVLTEGLKKGDRTTHELLLKCIIIITSVVPRQLPMQMALAVNTALMSLMKSGIFCTEPFRVPFAGKVSHCLFDKTGTLTTDQLIPIGVNCSCGGGGGGGGGTGTATGNKGGGGKKAAAAPPQLDVGVAVLVHGLKGAAELNGQTGTIVLDAPAEGPAAGRFTVSVGGRQVRVKAANLTAHGASAGGGGGGVSAIVGDNDVDANDETAAMRREAGLSPVAAASPEAAMVLAGCHALVSVAALEEAQQQAGSGGGGSKAKAAASAASAADLIGDPIELAGLRGVEWTYSGTTQTATPGNAAARERAIAALDRERAQLPPAPPQAANNPAWDVHRAKKAELAARGAALRRALQTQASRVGASPLVALKIVHRYHFDSKLQRMAVVAQAAPKPAGFLPRGGGGEHAEAARVAADCDAAGGWCCLVKGSPERVSSLLAAGSAPPGLEAAYVALAERGMRVLALAIKWGKPPADQLDASGKPLRSWVESELTFAGLVAFSCKMRSDSATVVTALREVSLKHPFRGCCCLLACLRACVLACLLRRTPRKNSWPKDDNIA